MSKEQKIDFAIGGQAVMEGVMMRSPNYVAVAVRKHNKSIKIKNDPYRSVVVRLGLAKIPIIRGMIGFFEMMVIGINALNFSAQENLDESETVEEEGPETFWQK